MVVPPTTTPGRRSLENKAKMYITQVYKKTLPITGKRVQQVTIDVGFHPDWLKRRASLINLILFSAAYTL